MSTIGQRGTVGTRAAGRAVELIVICEVAVPPFGLMELGERLQVDPAGAPEHVSAMVWLKPPVAAAVRVKVALCPALMVAELGEKLTAKSGVAAVVQVPLRETEWGLPGAESVMVTEPVRLPVAVGVNFTFTVQLAPGFRVEQLLVWEKSPLALMPVIVNAALPPLEMSKLLATLAVFNCCALNVRLEADKESRGPVAVLQLPPAGAISVPPPNS